MTMRAIGLALCTAIHLAAASGCAGAPPPVKVASYDVPEIAAPVRGTICVSIARDSGDAVADTRVVQSWPEKSYGREPVAFAGRAGGARQMLIDFDLRRVPAGARIQRATLVLHRATSGASAVTVHRITAPWSEPSATWTSFAHGYEPQAVTGVPDGGERVDSCGAVSIDLTSLVSDWASGTVPRHGVVLRQERGNTAFATSEADRAEQRPHLDVCYEAG